MIRIVAAATLVLLAACALSQEGNRGSAPAVGLETRLSWSAPDARIQLAPAPERASLIEFTVGTVRNPEMEGVTLALALLVDTRATPIPITTISPFPSDQPGIFIVRLPAAAVAALDASRERRAALSVALVTTAGSRKSAQLALEVSNVQWLAEPK
jgi:hypothetical protein